LVCLAVLFSSGQSIGKQGATGLMNEIGHFINGKIVADGSHSQDITDPATGDAVARVFLADPMITREAISIAEQAFPAWAAITPLRRSRVMFRFKDLLERHQDMLARMISREHGKVFSDARAEITRGLEVVEFACGIPHLLKGEYSEEVGSNVDSFSVKQPLGVCVGITPFNFPAMVPMWMFPIALACGNSFILKPSEKDPGVSLKIAELLQEAGLPDGVFNVLQGDKDCVDILLADERVAAVSFVGSTPVAEYIYRRSSETGKRVQALGGAKNHLVVMPDADLSDTVDGLMGSAFGAAGERCMAISVAVAVGSVADDLVVRLKAKVGELRVGPGLDVSPENDMGPLISKEHLDKVTAYVQTGVAEGAELVVDGRDKVVEGAGKGFFLGGCLFDKVTAEMQIYQEEIFGPVLVVVRVPDYRAAVDLVAGHQFGNGAAIFTRDGDTARAFAKEVTCGMVGVNVPIPVPMAFHSFGGWKKSKFGVLNMHGQDGVRFYTRLKTVTARWPKGERQSSGFVMPTN